MKKTLIIMALLGSMSAVSGQLSEVSARHVKTFEYRHIGTIGGDSHSFFVDGRNDTVTLSYEDLLMYETGKITEPVDSTILEQLTDLCARHNIDRWDGIDEVNREVLDGSGFSLYVKYDDGKRISAHGMNAWPEGYRAFVKEMYTILEPAKEQAFESARQKKIQQGVQGPLEELYLEFHQRGESGDGDIEIALFRLKGGNRNKLNVDCRSHSGALLPEGTHHYTGILSDKTVAWDKFEKLLRKHNAVQYTDYRKEAAEPYHNEQFALEFVYENGKIKAYGTLHPEDYDSFREDLLRLVWKTLQRALKSGEAEEL